MHINIGSTFLLVYLVANLVLLYVIYCSSGGSKVGSEGVCVGCGVGVTWEHQAPDTTPYTPIPTLAPVPPCSDKPYIDCSDGSSLPRLWHIVIPHLHFPLHPPLLGVIHSAVHSFINSSICDMQVWLVSYTIALIWFIPMHHNAACCITRFYIYVYLSFHK